MRFRATDVYDYYRPSPCARRVALRARGEPEQDTVTAFNDLLKKLGNLHEKAHLATLPGVVDLSPPLDQSERERRTQESIRVGAAAIYQPRFRLELLLDDDCAADPCELVGEPDFLIRDSARGGYLIRDSKLARHPLSGRHLGIPLQLQIYGLLYERAVGEPALGLEVHAGTGEIVLIAYAGEAAVLAALRDHRRMRAADPSDYEPVGWTKCGGCGFEERCRGEAEAAQDVSLLTNVRQDRARDLHARGIASIRDIAAAIDDPAHRGYFWQGTKKPRLKDFVAGLRRGAEAFVTNTPIPIAPPELPDARNVAVLDLEGLPPYIDELEKTYLWGVKVFGENPSGYLPAQSGFGPNGDREGWFAFLDLADRLFTNYGDDLPFIHWSPYDRAKIELYRNRYGDYFPAGAAGSSAAFPPPPARRGEGRGEGSSSQTQPATSSLPLPPPPARRGEGRGEGSSSQTQPAASSLPLPPRPATRGEGRGEGSGVAAHILANLVDLYRVVKDSVVLPVPSYSLKVVDDYVGFRRKLEEANGSWSIAKYIEATETADPAARAAILDQILAYNEEDLDATWAVMEWVRKFN